MNRRGVAPALAVAALLVASSASAQNPSQPSNTEPNRVGLTMGYPAAIGLIWEVSDRLALRPELSFSVGTSEASVQGVSGTSSDTWTVGIGVSALFYVGEWDALRTYIAPRFIYSRATSSVDSSFFGDGNDLKSEGITINGLFGAEYSLHRRFSVFGEVGAGFSSSETRSSTPIEGRTESSSFGARTGVGVIFYF